LRYTSNVLLTFSFPRIGVAATHFENVDEAHLEASIGEVQVCGMKGFPAFHPRDVVLPTETEELNATPGL